jgi:16S rRNA (uracil1498-N3)-methyltransferase
MMSGGKSLTRLYVPGELVPGRAYALPQQQAHHATRVMRLKAGDAVTLFNGDGAEYDAVVARVAGDAVSVRVGDTRACARESPLEIVLGQALSSGERMDYTVQKAVELGVTAIHPLAAARSVVRLAGERAEKRVVHWQAVAVSACEQSGRNRVPSIAPVAELAAWLARSAEGGAGALRLLLSPAGATRLRDLPRPEASIVLLAGPEGGFTSAEEAAARHCGFTPVRLGPRVLRTETAAAAALAALQALWGDF